MSEQDNTPDTSGDARAQIAELRAKVEQLLAERTQAVSRKADRLEAYAGDVAEAAQYRVDALSDRIRERPLGTLFVVGLTGFVLARLLGR